MSPGIFSMFRHRRMLHGLKLRVGEGLDRSQAAAKAAAATSEELTRQFKNEYVSLESRQLATLSTDLLDWDEQLETRSASAERKTFNSLTHERTEAALFARQLAEKSEQETKAYSLKKEMVLKEYDVVKLQPLRQLEKTVLQFRESLDKTNNTYVEAEQQLIHRGQRVPPMPDSDQAVNAEISVSTVDEAFRALDQLGERMRQSHEALRKHPLARLASSALVWLVGILLGLAIGLAGWMLGYTSDLLSIGIGVSAAVAVATLILVGLRPVLHRLTRVHFPIIQSALQSSLQLAKTGNSIAEQLCKAEQVRLREEYRVRMERLDAEHRKRLESLQLNHDEKLTRLRHEQQSLRVQLAQEHRSHLQSTNQQRLPDHQSLRSRLDFEKKSFQSAFEEKNKQLLQDQKKSLAFVEQRLRHGVRTIAAHMRQLRELVIERFPKWEDPRWAKGEFEHNNLAAVLPIGNLDVTIESHSNYESLAEIPRLAESMPLLFQLVEHGSLLLEASPSEQSGAHATLRDLVLRAFSSLPAGGLQLTIIDSEGLGREFAWLMQLADTDPKMVNYRVWTQPAHIAEQLAKLSHHAEDVIQQLLRDRYADIRAYNADAGSMAEPFRLVVWSRFPFGVDDHSWKSLCSLISSGGRCGVSVILLVDPTLAWPPMIDRSRLSEMGLHLMYDQSPHGSTTGQIRVVDDVLGQYPLALNPPPSNAVQNLILEKCARDALTAARIEVPFETIVPQSTPIQAATSGDGLEIPIGQAGVGRPQSLRLGSGTSQHVLIAGKTGSGKSSLLHTMITSAVLKYAPDQLRLVLLDFKKGVEFQSYAEQKLTHADIIGIESQREFGLSTLEYLDRVMQRRGELFRQEGVQDIPSWVRKHPKRAMPRILILVDEFQELFVEDDKLAQQASMLLDRIVRQGRSFGMHVVLASQTLGGAYSLPRTTLAQMAVRIALQCEGSDAMIILSDDNMAAERLRHSGQAVYNDASGRIEGNQPFQVAYLSKAKQSERLAKLPRYSEFLDETNSALGRQVIFEGHRAATWDRETSQQAIASMPQRDALSIVSVLGDSVSIEPAVAIQLSRQTGRNVLIVGTEDENAANCIISLLASGIRSVHNSNSNRVGLMMLDGSRPDDIHAAKLPVFVRSLDPIAQLADSRSAGVLVQSAGAELERRLADIDGQHDATLIVISQLGRFRDLRRSDDFAFGGGGETTKTPDAWLQDILRDGPSVGMFSIIWVDNANTLARWLPRQSMHDLEIRILMQMSNSDSNQLIDSPLANRLNPHVLLVQDEATGRARKFRPYRFDDASAIVDWALGEDARNAK